MAILVSIVSRPYQGEAVKSSPTIGAGGFHALKPAISIYPQFLEMLVLRLSSADHALCANALQLINSLMRDAITTDASESEWPQFIKRLQDLGVIKAVYILMQGSALQDLAHPLLEFQALTKVLLRRWREIAVDLLKPEHRRTIKGIHLASKPEPVKSQDSTGNGKPPHNPYKWRRLGFTTESPEPDFHDMGFLGMMDLADFVRHHQDLFQAILLEQASMPLEKRCPIACASLVVTAVLYEHFEIDRHDWEDNKAYMQLESRTNFERVFKPLLLQWSRLHAAGLKAFLRLWKATGAQMRGEGDADEGKDFTRVLELVRILVESVIGGAERGQGLDEVEREMAGYELGKLRELQMELLELTYEDVWGQHLRGVREELMSEALQFVKEQRVRCLLAGSWFPVGFGYQDSNDGAGGPVRESGLRSVVSGGWRFVRLDEQRKHLHYGDYEEVQEITPEIGELEGRIDLNIVSSVVSNVTAGDGNGGRNSLSANSDSTAKDPSQERDSILTTTKITIHGFVPETSRSQRHRHKISQQSHHTRATSKSSSSRTAPKESVLLTIHPQSQMAASEWLDGLLMLLDQQPITAETNRLVQMIGGFGVRVRLLNVRSGDADGDELGDDGNGVTAGVKIPSREGLEGQEFYYRM
jgi:engulfment and cell motility protein 1